MAIVYLILAVGLGALVYKVVQRQDGKRRQTGGTLTAEYRTNRPLDECIDALRTPSPQDIFVYTARRQPDGSFLVNFTLHSATQQPMDTVYQLRMDSGRQTLITLDFVREAFGSPEPVFGPELLDSFICAKFEAQRTL